MPTSVLLAVLAAAGLLALAPALVRRYDATERLVAERTTSTARVLDRTRRRRTVPGRRPINPPRHVSVTPSTEDPPFGGLAARLRLVPRLGRAATPMRAGATATTRSLAGSANPAAAGTRLWDGPSSAVYRRRRLLAALILLNLVELAGVPLIGPGMWVAVAATLTLLATYLAHLRSRALRDRRLRRIRAQEAHWLAERQAAVRQAQARRSAARREAQRRLVAQREALRRSVLGIGDPDLPAVAVGGSVSYRPTGVRGRAYQASRPGTRPA